MRDDIEIVTLLGVARRGSRKFLMDNAGQTSRIESISHMSIAGAQ